MFPENAVVAVCNTVTDAEAALAEARRQGVAADAISVVSVEGLNESATFAYYYRAGALYRAPEDERRGGLWRSLSNGAILASLGERVAVVAGPLAGSVVQALEQEELLGRFGALAGGLYNLGCSRDAAREYELAALQGRSLIVVHGRARDVERARHILAAWLPASEAHR